MLQESFLSPAFPSVDNEEEQQGLDGFMSCYVAQGGPKLLIPFHLPS